MQDFPIPDLLKDSDAQRRTMVDCQIRTFDVTDRRVIGRFLAVPRELFLPDESRALAYSDIGFVVPAPNEDSSKGEGRYLLPPLVLARLIQGARILPTERVLDVAPGTGYGTAILAGLAAEVMALESDEPRRADLEARLRGFGLTNVRTRAGGLADGAASDAPFDVIVVNGSVQTNLTALTDQLAPGGRLLAIKREAHDPTGRAGKAMRFDKHAHGTGARYLFDASAPCLAPFQERPQFVF